LARLLTTKQSDALKLRITT